MRKAHFFLIFIFLLNFQYSYGDELLQKFNQIFIENRELSYELSIKTYNDPSSTKNEKGIASYYLGKYFFEKDDEDNENNLSKAYDYFKISSEKYNFANAHEMLGIMYSNSIYVSQNYEKSNYYLEKAINEKNFASYGILSDNYYFQGDWDKAELYAKKCIDFYDNTKIYATKKNQISCTYDLAWFLSNHNMSDERNVEAINLYKSIEQVDVRAAINLAYFYSDPMDARQIEINLLSKFDYFKSNYDKGLLSAELADHYNHIVKPKSAIKYANDSINFFQLARENSKTKYLEDIIFLQFLHFLFKKIKEIKGKLSYQLIFFLHFGHKDLPLIICSFLGKR